MARTDGQAEQKLIELKMPPVGKPYDFGSSLTTFSPGEIGARRGDKNMIGGR